eukprot:CAMPEP_0114315930 /NCGR_PEP_ID=MMETSP0059-20121206/22889_1 /TAXON_ID=36894 /ORGANISM="Pyramimonas parkeae, Strain CCMP726" /LENGTH=43 /DNA_ID= /DNA_START= /DNA_END= /DNA_ORIENTATION=
MRFKFTRSGSAPFTLPLQTRLAQLPSSSCLNASTGAGAYVMGA